jgi:hypothetical protein
MDTLAVVLRYGFVLALLVEAVLIGRAFWGLLQTRATARAAAAETAQMKDGVEEA